MKKLSLLNYLLAVLFTGMAIIFTSCEKDDEDINLSPTFESVKMSNDNSSAKVIFSEAVYANTDMTGNLEISDFIISITGDSKIDAEYTLTHTVGTDSAIITITSSSVFYGNEILTVKPADEQSVFDVLGLAMSASEEGISNNLSEQTGYLHGMFITSEGIFNNNNGSINYYNTETNELISGLFEQVNGNSPGDIVQCFTVIGEEGYIVVNNSNKIEVVNMRTFESIATIEVNYPRYIVGANGKAYVSAGTTEGKVHVINTESYSITETIDIGKYPENIISSGNYVYVSNQGNSWTDMPDSTVSVIDVSTDQKVKNVTVGQAPTNLVKDTNGDVWVMCTGTSSIVKIDISDNSAETPIQIGDGTDWFPRLAIGGDGTKLFFTYAYIVGYTTKDAKIFSLDISSKEITEIVNIYDKFSSYSMLYGFNIDPETNNMYILIDDMWTYSGEMFVYSSTGTELDFPDGNLGTYPAGITFN